MEPMKTDKVYICPMHPDIREDKPGSCPKCGMNLEEIRESPKENEA